MEQTISAEALYQNGEYKKASLMAKKAMEKLMKAANNTDAIRALEIRVNAMYALQDYEKAIVLLGEVLTEFKRKGERHYEVLVTSLMADAFLSKGDAPEALRKAEEAKELAKDQRDRTGEAVALRTLAKIKVQGEQLDDAIQFSYKVADIMQECKDPEAQGFEMYSIASLHLSARQYNDSIAAVKKAVSLFRKVGNKEAEANALRIGAEAFWYSGVLRQASWQGGRNECALSMCLAACELYKAVGNAEDQIATGIMTAKLLLELQEFEEAYERAVELWQTSARTNSSKAQVMETIKISIDALTNRYSARKSTSTLKSQKGWVQAAVDAAHQLVAVSIDTAKTEQAEANRMLAKSLLIKGNLLADDSFPLAVQAAEKYLALAAELQDRSLEAAACLLLAEAHLGNQDINAAIEANTRAADIYKDMSDLSGQAKVEALRQKFRFSDQWRKVRVKAADGTMRSVVDVEKEAMPSIARGWQQATVYIHFDNLAGRAAKNIG